MRRVQCLVFVQSSELRSSSVIEPTFSKPVKSPTSNIKSCHFGKNIKSLDILNKCGHISNKTQVL